MTPDDRFLVATGHNQFGVYIYDLVDNSRLVGDADGIITLDERRRLGPWVTTPDGSTLAVLGGSLMTYELPDLREYGTMRWIDPESPISAWQSAWAYDAPTFAFGVAKDSRVLWFRLRPTESA
ncbi:hypothetical protein ACFQO7_32470 [Catellatospora aurea]|uniref:WD40 repeat protein n=1 Tax=Catellatospora aurea TaxID=1337874 RepID=A0ABW2HA46_9ACTN